MPMTSSTGNLTYEILARGHHHHYSHYGSSHGSSGPMQWWMWAILGLGAVALIYSWVKKLSK
ncbi:hypothetical protein B1H19_24670 [Streptomyces gilvosporeus]|uniref:Uncharacterized protein n=2 Tax=Streptomyces gilvosporeus TaxID=553510 RepID=A0A1V0TVG3_9ACTN|nr:hypothetical protein B1H19_24670 [Streptomyces gilvosporeus]